MLLSSLIRTSYFFTEWIDGSINPSYCSNHTKTTNEFAISYCFIVSCIFVLALHILVPKKIRKRDRNHPSFIRWRAFISLLVCLLSMATYPLLFCDLTTLPKTEEESNNNDELTATQQQQQQAVYHLEELLQTNTAYGVIIHTIILYLGPIVAGLLYVYEYRQRQRNEEEEVEKREEEKRRKEAANNNSNSNSNIMMRRSTSSSKIIKVRPSYLHDVYTTLLKPSIGSILNPLTKQERWINYRNFIIAPLTEELVFRQCFVAVLLSTGMSPVKVSWIAPIFFGVAHIHHAISKLGTPGMPLSRIIIMTIFQFIYTSLFGSYAAYAYIRTGSIIGVIISHSYCNWMGLPDVSFLRRNSPIYKYRTILVASYVLGVWAFHWFISNSSYLLPLPPILPQLIVPKD